MVDEVLARVVLLGHRPVVDMLEADVAMDIDLGRHDRLAGQIHAGRSGWRLQLATATDPCELRVLDDECGVLDRRAAVAGDEPRPFEDRHAGVRPALCFHREEHAAMTHTTGTMSRHHGVSSLGASRPPRTTHEISR